MDFILYIILLQYTANSDYTEILAQTLPFDVLSNREVCVDVTISNDVIFEENEEFQLTLSQSSPPPMFPPVTINPALSTVMILDDDCEQQIHL